MGGDTYSGMGLPYLSIEFDESPIRRISSLPLRKQIFLNPKWPDFLVGSSRTCRMTAIPYRSVQYVSNVGRDSCCCPFQTESVSNAPLRPCVEIELSSQGQQQQQG